MALAIEATKITESLKIEIIISTREVANHLTAITFMKLMFSVTKVTRTFIVCP